MLSLAKVEKMAKLTDTQLIVLSKAAARDDGAGIIPDRINKSAAAKISASLIARKLMREVRAKAGMPIWRQDEGGRGISLIITRTGRDAIGLQEASASQPQATSKTGNEAIVEEKPSRAAPRTGTKQALVVGMLAKEDGATLDALIEATGWLPHTTRAALTGLRKRGYSLERTRDRERGSVYRIVQDPKPAIAA
jgi:hypothetical protein